MSYRLVFDVKAIDELESAEQRYDTQQEGVSWMFLFYAGLVFNQISKFPRSYPVNEFGIREANLLSFPFIILYKIKQKSKEVIIASIFHTKQNPRNKISL